MTIKTYLVIHVLGITPGLVLGLLAVKEVLTLCFSELVDLSTGETCEELLGELVRDGLACKTLYQHRTITLMQVQQALGIDLPSLRW
jgi:hypothetical protein